MANAYAQAFLLKRKLQNEDNWILGAYVANAFGTVLANSFGKKKTNYLDKPFDLFPKTEAEKENEKREERLRIIHWLTGLKKASNQAKNTGSDSDGKP